MTAPRRFVPLVLAALLAACSRGGGGAPALAGTSLEGAPIGGDFSLIDQGGKPVRWGDFKGRYRIVYFGYTFCPDACPLDMGVTIRGLDRFEKAHPASTGKIAAMFITIDPARDTPARMGEFVSAFGHGLIGLTGSPAAIDRAAKAFKVYYARGKDTPGGYLMDHSRFAYLMAPDGTAIEALPADKGPEAVAADLALAIK